MNNTNLQIKFERRFLLENLPEPLTRASQHLQFFDNHLTETRLVLRQVRTPQTKQWKRYFVQKYAVAPPDLSRTANAEIELSEYEYEVLSVFEGNELRYNRYFYELDGGKAVVIDMVLNRELWNLILATVEFESAEEMKSFEPPQFFGREITNDENLTAAKLVDLTLADVQKHLGR